MTFFFPGSFMGDIAMADENYQSEWSFKGNKSSHQEELEKLKKEVYSEGLQVEEEGLTDILRKKIKQPLQYDSLRDNDKLLNEAMIVSITNFERRIYSKAAFGWGQVRCMREWRLWRHPWIKLNENVFKFSTNVHSSVPTDHAQVRKPDTLDLPQISQLIIIHSRLTCRIQTCMRQNRWSNFHSALKHLHRQAGLPRCRRRTKPNRK